MTSNEVWSFSYDAEGNLIEEQDIPLVVDAAGRHAHQDSQRAEPAYILRYEANGRLGAGDRALDATAVLPETVSYSFGQMPDCDSELLMPLGRCTCGSHPTQGRWLQLDPIGFEADDANLHSYVTNDPTEPSE